MTQKARTTTDGQRVGFRWRQHEDAYRRRLAESAEEAGRELNEHARELLKAALAGPDEVLHNVHMLRQEVSELKHELGRPGGDTQAHSTSIEANETLIDGLEELEARLDERLRALGERQLDIREDVVNCAVKLLVDIGKVSPEHAREWAGRMLGDPSKNV